MTRHEKVKAANNVIRAALEWWEGKRPIDWTIAQHLNMPAVNAIATVRDTHLAHCVAALVKANHTE